MELYKIDKHYLDVIENGYSIDEETGEVLFDASSLDSLEMAFNDKVDNIVCYVKDLEALVKAIKDEEKALSERRKANEAKIERLKEYVAHSMQLRDMAKLETAKNKLSFRKSQSVNVLDEAKIDGQYFTQKVEFKMDKKRILADLKNGVVVEGCELLEKNNLQIK